MDIDKWLTFAYNKENYNCATMVCQYYRELGYGNLPDGDLAEFSRSALFWIKNNFEKIDRLEKHCLVVCRNLDGTLHVAVFDGRMILHNTSEYGGVLKQLPPLFFRENKDTRIFRWRHSAS